MKIYDKDIRKLLLREIANTEKYYTDPSTVIIHEMDVCLGCARIDIAVINGEMHGYEIKSGQDNLERLPSQVKLYNKIFDTITLAVTEAHYRKALELTPDWWGLCHVFQDKGVLSLVERRAPGQNIKTNTFLITQLLWKDELRNLLKENDLFKGIKSKTRFQLGEIVVDNISKEMITGYVRSRMKERKTWKALQLPKSAVKPLDSSMGI